MPQIRCANSPLKHISSCFRRLPGKGKRLSRADSENFLEADQEEVRIGDGILKFTPDQLKEFTGGFSDENYLDGTSTRSGFLNRVYRGKVIIDEESNWVRNVIVEVKEPRFHLEYDVWEQTQIRLFTDPVIGGHPNVAKLYGYCNDGMLGLVYDCDALQTMHNMVPDESFTWAMRMKVAFGLAHLLEFLESQTPPLRILNLEAHSILIDKHYNPLVFGFGVAFGGILRRPAPFHLLQHYICWLYSDFNLALGIVPPSIDVYGFGASLLTLITKRHDILWCTYHGRVPSHIPMTGLLKVSPNDVCLHDFTESIVQRSFLGEDEYLSQDGSDVTQLTMECVKVFDEIGLTAPRPEISDVVNRLKRLAVVCKLGLQRDNSLSC
ncbi:probable serine/threonine-protein kinase PBL16 isoform X1 [Elaeis guineensis]|uniref:probable serine/threonine-protein kinase PBL16 isoform X1 n=1 Tax=Elaeis guineensis var. tenera TaxID=51953 RepID=UPI003C6D5DCE